MTAHDPGHGLDLEAIRARVLDEARRAPPPRRWYLETSALIAAYGLVVAASLAIAVAWFAPRIDGDAAGAALIAAVIAAGAAAAMRPRARRLRYSALALAAVAGAVAVATSAGGEPATWTLHDAQCAIAELAVSLVPGALTVLALRRSAYEPLRALVGGLAAAASGLLVLHLTCPVDGAPHALAFHVTPWLLVAGLLALVRARLRSASFAP